MFYTGIYPILPLPIIIYLPLFTCFYENWYSPIIMHLNLFSNTIYILPIQQYCQFKNRCFFYTGIYHILLLPVKIYLPFLPVPMKKWYSPIIMHL